MRSLERGDVGGNRLAPRLGIDDKTVEVALRQLKKEGLLVGQGRSRFPPGRSSGRSTDGSCCSPGRG